MILKICIGNAVIEWIWTKGYIVGYVPKWLSACSYTNRKSPCFWQRGAKLGEDFVFFINPGGDHFSVNRPAQQRTRKVPWTFDSNFILLCHVWERPHILIYLSSLSRENNMLLMAICFQCGKQFIFQSRACLDLKLVTGSKYWYVLLWISIG